MRTLVLVGLLAACDKGKPQPEPLSAPQAELMKTVADGVYKTPRTDAAIIDGATIIDGPEKSVAISRAGVGTLGKLAWWKLDNAEVFARITAGMGLPGTTVGFDVMELPFVDETEEGYFSLKRGDEELAQVLRTQGAKGEEPAAVVIWTREIPTADGIAVGDKVDALLAKHPDLGCKVDMYGTFIGMIAVYIACTSPAEPEITYFINAGKQMFKNGKIAPKQLANLAIVGIGHEFVGS
jgi:hypothetical protein